MNKTSLSTPTSQTPRRAPVLVSALALAALLISGCSSMSERERGTAGGAGIGAVVGGALGAVLGNVWSKRQEERRIKLEQATQGTGVEVTRTADNQLKLNIPNDVSFDTNSSAIRPEMRNVLDPFAAELRGDPNARVAIVGHTDSTGSTAVNNPLSVDRAISVRDYLVARGVPAMQVQTNGRGEAEPVASNDSESGRARNRRVEIYPREPAA